MPANITEDTTPQPSSTKFEHSPPYAVKIVELVPAPWTDPAVTQKTRERFEAMGHYPSTLKKEIPGFIMNRFQAAIMFEAFYRVGEGVVSIADVDRAMAEGISQRWSLIGPIGDHILEQRRGLLPEAKLAERQRWRDKRLMALAQHKKWANENIE